MVCQYDDGGDDGSDDDDGKDDGGDDGMMMVMTIEPTMMVKTLVYKQRR